MPTPNLPTEEDKKEILKVTIEELRSTYAWLCNAYREVKTKILTFIGGGLAVLTFLYAGGDTFIPNETYGQIFYFAALGLILLGFGLLFTAMRPSYWEFPTERKDLDKLDFDTEIEYLDYVKNRYLHCYGIDVKVYEFKHRMLNTSFYLLLFGAIMLIVINIFGG